MEYQFSSQCAFSIPKVNISSSKMKLSFSFLLCSVLIYSTILCSNVSAEEIAVEESDGVADDDTCIVQYFKSKGKLPEDFPSKKASSTLCRFTMIEVQRVIREIIKSELKEKLPKETDCVMEQFEKNQGMDLFLLVGIILAGDKKCQHEGLLQGSRDETKELFKTTAVTCGLNEDMLMPVYGAMFEKKTETKTETA